MFKHHIVVDVTANLTDGDVKAIYVRQRYISVDYWINEFNRLNLIVGDVSNIHHLTVRFTLDGQSLRITVPNEQLTDNNPTLRHVLQNTVNELMESVRDDD